MDKTIVVMAAGLGSRYGGVKQIERLGPDGEILMEYAIYDAIRAGFNRIVLIIKPEIYNDVRELFGNRIEESTGIKIDYAFQTLDRFTESRPEFKARTKPFGTVHAVICAADCIKTPFAVMNADDYYGAEAFRVMSEQLEKLHSAQDAAMVAYRLKTPSAPSVPSRAEFAWSITGCSPASGRHTRSRSCPTAASATRPSPRTAPSSRPTPLFP